MTDATTAFGVGITGTGISILTLVGWIVARGIRSKCILGGNVMSVDIHRATQEETAAMENERNHSAIEIRPQNPVAAAPTPVAAPAVSQNPVPQNPIPTASSTTAAYPTKSTENAGVIIEPAHIPVHPIRVPKTRISKPTRNTTPKSTPNCVYYEPAKPSEAMDL
jgi:hypothetical protein